MKGDPYEKNIPNTFAPNCRNKKFSVAMLAGSLKYGFIDTKKFPPDVAKRVWAEQHKQFKIHQKEREEKEKELEAYKQKTKQDYDIRYLADVYLSSRFQGISYWIIERVCSLKTLQLKKFLEELANLIDDELLDRRIEKKHQRCDSKIPKYRLVDEFLDAIPMGNQEHVIDEICNLDDSKNELLSYLSGTIGCIKGYYKDKPELKSLRSNQRHII